MLKDPLQERLKKMELDNPSLDQHPKTFLDYLLDQFYFVARYFNSSVKEYTDHQRACDLLVAAKKEIDHTMFYRQAVGPKEQTSHIEAALFWRELGLDPNYHEVFF